MKLKEPKSLEPNAEQFRRLDWLSRLLDTAWPIPGTPYRIGLDGILGLIPGIGDTLGMVLSSYLIFEAARMGAPGHILLRMVGNVALESVLGAIPILGDIFDIAWKANVRNLALLRSHKDRLFRRERSSRQIMLLIVAALVLLLITLIALSVVFVQSLYQLITP